MPEYHYICKHCGYGFKNVCKMSECLNKTQCNKCKKIDSMHIHIFHAPTVIFKDGPPTKPIKGGRHGWQGGK